jgi:ribosomal protein S18 acetylase RimI-like enzyme
VSGTQPPRGLLGSAHADLELVPVDDAVQVARVGKLAEEIWLEHYPAIIGLAQTRYMIDTLQNTPAVAIHIARGALYFLLQHGGTSVGYAAIELQPERAALFVSKLYLLRDLRGLGLGQRALEALVEMAREQGLRRLELTVNRNNALALRCYARFGMTIEGTQLTEIGEGYAMDDYVLAMALTG